MDIELAINTAKSWQKGSIHSFVYSRKARLPKKLEGNVLEITSKFQARVGIDYDNIASVKEARENGKAKGGLSGVEQVEEDFLFIGKDGQTLLRVYPVKSDYHGKSYVLNGEETDAETLLASGYAKSVLGIREHKEGDLGATAMYLDPAKIVAMR